MNLGQEVSNKYYRTIKQCILEKLHLLCFLRHHILLFSPHDTLFNKELLVKWVSLKCHTSMENQEWLELNQLHYMNKKSIPQASKQWQARSEYS